VSDLGTFGLAKAYGATRARWDRPRGPTGAIYGVVGPNGSGKTTALEIRADLRRPSAGRIELGVTRDAVAYCPDTAKFEPWLTAFEVLDVAAGLLGRPRPRACLVTCSNGSASWTLRIGVSAVSPAACVRASGSPPG
jgi:ABC-2 type transport system ATP-binding protein